MKRALLAASAVFFTSFAAVPAYAGPNDNIPLNPIIDTTGMTPQQVCEAVLRPNDDHSGFQTAPTNEEDNVVLNSTTTQDSTPFDHVGTGTPTYANYSGFDGSYHRNGGSPNVWTGAQANTETFATSDLYYHTTVHETLGSTFGCAVWKDPGGADHGPDAIYPPGLQSTGNSTVTGTNTYAGDDVIDHNGGSYTSPGSFYDSNVLICISPNNVTKGKPGTWTKKNGFTGSCETANSIAGGTVPSGNAP